jgi:arsenate reductase-like glutaredoxin family protein
MSRVKHTLTRSNVQRTDLVGLLQDLRDAVNALISDHNTLRAKLNSDAGVTDTNYAASTGSTISGV